MARKLEVEALRDLRDKRPEDAEFESLVAEKLRGLVKELKDLK